MSKRNLPVLGRRELLLWAGAAGATSAVGCAGTTPARPEAAPAASAGPPEVAPVPPPVAPPPAYFTSEEAEILNALADAVLPPDDVPGGSALGVVSYAEQLLTAFDKSPPKIFAGGPYSGRTALPSSTGRPSASSPADDFSTFLPLDRVQLKGWQLRILGSSGVSGGGPNDAITGPVIGLREAVATAIAGAKAAMPAKVSVSQLTQADKTAMLTALDKATAGVLVELVLEASFSAPEYGGNPGQAGWKLAHFEGDSQPLGYSWFDARAGAYTEDPAHPVSKPNPYPDPMPMTASTEKTIALVIGVLGGKVFG